MSPTVVYLYGASWAELFSVSEAAAIAEVPPETIRTALEKKSVAPSFKRNTGKAVRYQFSVGDVLFMKVLVEFPFALSKEDKQSLAKILSRGNQHRCPLVERGADLAYRSRDMQVWLECKAFRQKVARNLSAFRWGKRLIASNPDVLGREPVFRGTRIPLQHVAALFRRDVPEKQIAEDFPESALATWPMLGSSLASARGPDDHEGGWLLGAD